MSFEVVAGPNKDKVSNLDELNMGRGDRFYVDQIIDLAKNLAKSVKKTADMHQVLDQHGFAIMRDGHRYLAVRESDTECALCHRR